MGGVKRFFDVCVAGLLLFFFGLPMLCLALLILITSGRPIIYWSERVGRDNKLFKMPKFRTMKKNTPPLATHLLKNPNEYITTVGKFLRKTSLDELPQLFNIFAGKMSFVGPRPALYNQDDLIALRTQKGIYKLIPGLTGWAQINGRDQLSITEKVNYDEFYLKHKSVLLDFKILWRTFFNIIGGKGISH
ncbi:MAG: sugar transferase [bacterium]|nr:sugar transferase [bacterium]